MRHRLRGALHRDVSGGPVLGGAAGAGRDHWLLAPLRQPEPPRSGAARTVIGCAFVLLLDLCANEAARGPGQPEASCDHGRCGSSVFPGFEPSMVACISIRQIVLFVADFSSPLGSSFPLRLGMQLPGSLPGSRCLPVAAFSGIGRLCVILAGSGSPCELG